MSAWQPIETAPKDGSVVLVAHSQGVWMARYENMYQSGFVPESPWFSMLLNHQHIGRYPSRIPTHWMPLPDPPDDEAAERLRIEERRTMSAPVLRS